MKSLQIYPSNFNFKALFGKHWFIEHHYFITHNSEISDKQTNVIFPTYKTVCVWEKCMRKILKILKIVEKELHINSFPHCYCFLFLPYNSTKKMLCVWTKIFEVLDISKLGWILLVSNKNFITNFSANRLSSFLSF